MKANEKKDVNKENQLQTGTILLAQPFWQEETYKRSVVLIVKHDDEGTTGIILNKLSNLAVNDALPDLEFSQPLYYGGPMGKEYISYIHGKGSLDNSLPVSQTLNIGGDLDDLEDEIRVKAIKFFAGFVQWGPHELDDELKDNKWWVSHIEFHELFLLPLDKLWQYKLLAAGHIYGIFQECPDPYLN
jgi:putative transcriptional regulator